VSVFSLARSHIVGPCDVASRPDAYLSHLAVKAAVSSCPGVAFLSLSGGDVYSCYVGEAEAAVRRAFALARQVGNATNCRWWNDASLEPVYDGVRAATEGRARRGEPDVRLWLSWQASPCVLFFDEIDAIVGGGRGAGAESRVLATFLNELDGVS
jgi:SpoVK/Ycf46/Vps4 family AAA+-type ATPase